MSIKRETANDLTKACLRLLALRGVFAWRMNNTGVRRTDKRGRQFWAFNGLRGIADVLGVCAPDGKFLAIEIKVGDDEQSPHQLAFEASVRDSGGLYFVVRSVKDLDELLTENGI